jgi:hypothetical protein
VAQGAKTGGRKSGTPNKLSASAKENIAAVFVRLGGYEAMTNWASENQTDFYKIYARLIPVELTGKDGGDIKQTIKVTFGN